MSAPVSAHLLPFSSKTLCRPVVRSIKENNCDDSYYLKDIESKETYKPLEHIVCETDPKTHTPDF